MKSFKWFPIVGMLLYDSETEENRSLAIIYEIYQIVCVIACVLYFLLFRK